MRPGAFMRAPLFVLMAALSACLPRPPALDTQQEGTGALSLDPGVAIDLGPVEIGCEGRVKVYATNTGGAPLALERIELVDGHEGVAWVPADELELPSKVEPSEEVALGHVSFAPQAELADQDGLGTLSIWSDDPDAEVVDLEVLASVPTQRQSDTHHAGHRAMDIVFTVDRSGSTMDDVMVLEDRIGEFVEALDSSGISFRILGVTQLTGCQDTGVNWIDESYSAVAAEGVFSDMVSSQPSSSEATQGLKRAENALSAVNLGSGGCNEAFLRDKAMLHIVGLSDDADSSQGEPGDYVDRQVERKIFPYEAVYHGIGAEVACGDAQAYSGFLEAATATQGHWVSFCDGDWSQQIVGLAYGMMNRADRSTYLLLGDPLESSITVEVDERLLGEDDWRYDGAANAVILGDGQLPSLGVTVKVGYYPEPDCD